MVDYCVLVLLLVCGSAFETAHRVSKPNILFVLSDDQDTVLGGDSTAAMPMGLPGMAKRGTIFPRWVTNSPICACSRATILTGKHVHRLLDDRPPADDPWDRRGNSFGPCFRAKPGGGCGGPAPGRNMHLNFSRISQDGTFAVHLANAGYRVGVFGKWLNRLPMPADGSAPLIPTGVDTWFVSPGDESNKSSWIDPSGEYYPSFYFFNHSVWVNEELEYETAFLGNRSLNWIRESTAAAQPWFLYLALHAPHGDATPAPWYTDLPVAAVAPRSPSWNYSGADHHWLIQQQPPITEPEARILDLKFKKRWRCLRAVDDLVVTLTTELRELGIDRSTYVFYTSDHGYHFGELRLGAGKWNVYDTDLRVPMLVTGPGVVGGRRSAAVGSHIDLAPTWLALAGLPRTPEGMDGRSLLHELIPADTGALPLSVAMHFDRSSNTAPTASASVLPRNGAYIEYHGLGLTGLPGRLGDSPNNTYRGLRVVDHLTGGLGNVLYAEFGDFSFENITFHEFYDMDRDPWQLHNVWSELTPEIQAEWAKRLQAAAPMKVHSISSPFVQST